MTSREQVVALLDEGFEIAAAAQRLGIPPGLAYLIATGRPADGSDSRGASGDRAAGGSTQRLVNDRAESPTRNESVLAWLRTRAAADGPMRHAADARGVEPPPVNDPPDRPALPDELTRQHNRVEYLIKELTALPNHSGGGSRGQVARRGMVAQALSARVIAHAAAEDRALWPLVETALPHGTTWKRRSTDLGVPGLARRLAALDPDTDEFDQVATELVTQSRRHSALCAELFVQLRWAVDEDTLRAYGSQIQGAGEPGPTRTEAAPTPSTGGSR